MGIGHRVKKLSALSSQLIAKKLTAQSCPSEALFKLSGNCYKGKGAEERNLPLKQSW